MIPCLQISWRWLGVRKSWLLERHAAALSLATVLADWLKFVQSCSIDSGLR